MSYWTDFEGWWRCCQEACEHREVNSDLYGTTCPDCGHEKCDECEEMDPSPSPEPEPQQQQQQQQEQDQDQEREREQQCDFFVSTEYTQHQQAYQGHHHHDHPHHHHHHDDGPGWYETPRPSLRGWWKCCQCEGLVNPAVSGWVCPVEYHQYCGYCTLYTR